MKKLICVLLLVALVLTVTGVTMRRNGSETAFAASDASTIEARGVWHRPNASGIETDLDGICNVLDRFKSAGINMVFLETYFHGMSVFKTAQVQYYTGFDKYNYGEYPDYATAFVGEAAKRGIEVHAWVEDFYIGTRDDNRFVTMLPNWLLLNKDGQYHQTEGEGYIFLDPANSEVRSHLVNFYDEMLTKIPQLKGLNLDYIRYPVSSQSDDVGFTQTCMTQFAQEKGLTLNTSSIDAMRNDLIAQISSRGLYSQWVAFRANFVTMFVASVFDMVKTKHPNATISTAIFPEADVAYATKKQDFRTWLQNGYLDMVTPMVYYYTASDVSKYVTQMMKDCQNCFCYTGLYTTYHNQSTSELLNHINASNNCNADGFVLFDSDKTFFHASQNYEATLQATYGSVSAVPPHASAQQLLTAIKANLQPVLSAEVSAGRENSAKIAAFFTELDKLVDGGDGYVDCLQIKITHLQALKNSLSSYISQSANVAVVSDQLQQVITALNIRKSRLAAKGFLNEPDPDPTVAISQTSLTLYVGQSVQLSAETMGDATLTWSSTAGGIAKVSATGKVTAVSVGTATINVRYGTARDTCVVTVVERPLHECQHVCETCGKCTDETCTDAACANKCQGHEPIVPPHECGHVCETCGKCTDAECGDPICADKCQGHEPIVPPHECGHVCETCGKCTDAECDDRVCADKCKCPTGQNPDPVEPTDPETPENPDDKKPNPDTPVEQDPSGDDNPTNPDTPSDSDGSDTPGDSTDKPNDSGSTSGTEKPGSSDGANGSSTSDTNQQQSAGSNSASAKNDSEKSSNVGRIITYAVTFGGGLIVGVLLALLIKSRRKK